ncbi:MAG: peptidoglycan DL-endopeptidase CwlO [Gaiellaceae bacterium]|jgi:cell wall-associated NlpC family hydrolase|nr:peptidoglycan DL-endopeptidase CwlO [Gaiellaceae bacterium]
MRRLGLLIAGALALATLVAGSAGAKTTPQIQAAEQHARAVKAEVERIGKDLESTIQAYDGARVELQQVKASLASNTHKLRIARANFHAAQKRIMARIYSLYVNGNPTTLDVLAGAKSLSQVIDRAEAAQAMSRQDAALGREALHFQEAVQQREDSLKELRAKRAKAVLSLAAKKQQIQSTLARQKQLLESIHSSIHQLQVEEARREERKRQAALARLREIQAEREREAEQAREQQQQNNFPPPIPPIVSTGAGHPEAASIGLHYLGVPYVWGGASPSGFDCSGLVMYVYAQLGIYLPHYTGSQWAATQPISMSQLQPGDLVFFDGVGHVGIYIGGGQMVDAPHTGAVVRIESIYGFGPIDGARRVP